jgi:glycosyltransferase involved in cell wall biosynthesis
MKILHVSPMYAPALGGSEHHLKAISEGLASRGHTVSIFAANVATSWDLWQSRCGKLPEFEVINGVNVVRFHPEGGLLGRAFNQWVQLKGGWRSVSYLFSPEATDLLVQGPQTLAMIPQIIRFKADVVASMNWYWPPAYHTYLAKRLKRFTLVGIPLFHTAQSWCERPIYRRMLASCDAVVVNTSHEGQFALERGAARVKVAGVGIDPKAFEQRNGNEIRERYSLGRFPVVGFVGRQIKKKGAFKLIEAMRQVWRWNKEVRLVLAGPRPSHETDIAALIENLSESQKKRIVQIGTFDEKHKAGLFDAFDVFALPSTEESFGIAYLEAWACAKPVIGARIGSTQCVIDDGVDGLLVDPGDPGDIARALITLLSNRDTRDRMGRSGYAKTMAQHTWDKVTDRVERVYLDLVAAKTRSCPSLAGAKRLSSWIQ